MPKKSGMSTHWQAIVLDGILRNVAITLPTHPWLALFTTPIQETDDIGGPTEVSGTGYDRVQLSFSAWADGFSLSSALAAFAAPTASWGTVVAYAICDAHTPATGHIIFFENDCPDTIDAGDVPPSFPAQGIKVHL